MEQQASAPTREVITPVREVITPAVFDDLKSRFTNHKPDSIALKAMADIRKQVRSLAYLIECLCPHSKEKATALTKLSFVMMSANSAIVQKCPVNEDELSDWEK